MYVCTKVIELLMQTTFKTCEAIFDKTIRTHVKAHTPIYEPLQVCVRIFSGNPQNKQVDIVGVEGLEKKGSLREISPLSLGSNLPSAFLCYRQRGLEHCLLLSITYFILQSFFGISKRTQDATQSLLGLGADVLCLL